MKYLVVFALIAFVAAANAHTLNLSEEARLRARGFAKACIEQEGVVVEAVKELKEGNFANVDAKLKSFINCFLEKVGFLANGVPQPDVIHTKLDAVVGAAEVNAIGEKCNGLKGADNADTAFKFYECYYTNHASWL